MTKSTKTSKPDKTLPSAQAENQPHSVGDFMVFQKQYQTLLERLRPLIQQNLETRIEDADWDPFNLQATLFKFWEAGFKKPQIFVDLQIDYWQRMSQLFTETTKKINGEDSQDVIDSAPSDRRFRDAMWDENAIFSFIKQSYLLTGDILQKSIEKSNGMEKQDRAKLNFMTKQFVDSLSPSNFACYNPEVIRETINSQGTNLLRGLENLIEDLERGNGHLDISKTNYIKYEVGKNLATTAGDVVFRNDLIELIQYAPATDTVFKTPILIIPPWINKYYILDMRQDNSFVKWAVDQGHTVFMISWANPTRKLANKEFSDYMKEGIFEALDTIEHQTGENAIHAVGYCIGGTLLATTLAYMAAHKVDKRISSATFLTTLIDFADSGDLKLFTDHDQLEKLEKKMSEKGYLDGRELRNTFSMLRANDLIWSFVVNNYLLGKEPFPFDLLYWNDDSTNMPARMHSFYLKNMYRDNLLCKPNVLTIDDTPIDIRKIMTPSYFLSTKDDHIAPWKATFEGMHLLGGKKKFVLSASGHVAGVVNPPASHKYHFWTIDGEIDDRDYPDEWLAKCAQTHGSWWSDWSEWLQNISSKRVKARKAKESLAPAPGTYVLKKLK